MAVITVAVPGAEAHDLGGLVVVGDAPLGEDLVAGGGDETVSGRRSLRVALVEVAQLPAWSAAMTGSACSHECRGDAAEGWGNEFWSVDVEPQCLTVGGRRA